MSDRSVHWEFALITALVRLEYLVWNFDFVTEVGEQGYVGVQTPEMLNGIIAGFLDECAWLFEGDQTRLIKMQMCITDQLGPAYHAGQATAQSVRQRASVVEHQQLLNAAVADVRQMGSERVPTNVSPPAGSWFMEGFCRQWWQIEYIHCLRRYV